MQLRHKSHLSYFSPRGQSEGTALFQVMPAFCLPLTSDYSGPLPTGPLFFPLTISSVFIFKAKFRGHRTQVPVLAHSHHHRLHILCYSVTSQHVREDSLILASGILALPFQWNCNIFESEGPGITLCWQCRNHEKYVSVYWAFYKIFFKKPYNIIIYYRLQTPINKHHPKSHTLHLLTKRCDQGAVSLSAESKDALFLPTGLC
jgi:hypothetical protein